MPHSKLSPSTPPDGGSRQPAAAARAARYAWAGLTTLPGLCCVLVALATGGGARSRAGVIEAWGGGVAWLLARTPVDAQAMALGHVILARTPDALDRLRTHELAHVRQAEQWGPFFLPAYLLASLAALARGGHCYRDNFFEIEARAAEAAEPQAPAGGGPAARDDSGKEDPTPPGLRSSRSLQCDSRKRS